MWRWITRIIGGLLFLVGAIGWIAIPDDIAAREGQVGDLAMQFDRETALIALSALSALSLSGSILVPIIGDVLAARRSLPMSDRRAEHLSFGMISEKWADEMKDIPGGWSKNKILHELLKAFWRGDFEDDMGNSKLTANYVPGITSDGRYIDENRNRILEVPQTEMNRRLVLVVMSYPPHVSLPPKSELLPDQTTGYVSWPWPDWEKIKERIPWESLMALEPDEYDEVGQHVYLSGLNIKKNDFKK